MRPSLLSLLFALRPDQQRQRRLQLSQIDKRTHQDSILLFERLLRVVRRGRFCIALAQSEQEFICEAVLKFLPAYFV